MTAELKFKPGKEIHGKKAKKQQKRSGSKISVPTSSNRLECELVEGEPKHSEEFSTLSELSAVDTAVVTVEVLEELTEEEVADRHRLELKI